MNVITLRPRGVIPFWDRDVYTRYSDWAHWFWKGAVHIDDVATAVILSLDLIARQQIKQQLVLTLNNAYEYTDADLDHWDADGAGSTLQEILFRISRARPLLRARSGRKADEAGYFRDGALAGLQTVLQSGEPVIGTGGLRRQRTAASYPGLKWPMFRRGDLFPLPAWRSA
jgi:hypothetical protein